ncbi:MAG: hypothetical protein QOD55_574 [Solirubrobacteraceae bacterium]|jgi:hypothetical protein|nr:hypothetical protein [Solirubrobacteraceae bacterium]
MSASATGTGHAAGHEHGVGCGHTAVEHEGHTDYLVDGHLHHVRGRGCDEHSIAVDARNPEGHTGAAAGHDAGHRHGAGCGHEAVRHGDHTDHLVDGRLHHAHGDHCDDHGPLTTV